MLAKAAPALAAGQRFQRLDTLRGLAIVWMVLFHLAFDLNHLGFLQPPHNFYRDALWTVQRTAIVSLFLLCVGLGQAAAQAAGLPASRFWRRWGQVVGCALLVSAGSALVFPRSWISFGVLHGVAVMLLVVRWLPQGLAWPLGLGGLALAMPRLWQHPWFDSSRLTSWVGLVTHKPVTEDYVPLLPWLGVVLCGLAAGRWLLQHRPEWLAARPHDAASARVGPLGAMTADVAARVSAGLAALGRWPLTVYMLHQPLLFGALLAWRQWRGA